MNHTQRIAHVARQKRYLTKALVREAVEHYLEALAEEIVDGDWVDIKGVGKLQVVLEEANVTLTSFGKDGTRVQRQVRQRLRTKIRLYKQLKQKIR
jgi:nucleoid DNA-binding protein